MITPKEELEIAQLFDLRGLTEPFLGKDRDTNAIRKLHLNSLWILKTPYFGHASDLIAAVVHTREWNRGLMLIRNRNGETYPENPKVLDIGNWDDPVISALDSINLIYNDSSVSLNDPVSYDMLVSTRNILAQLMIDYGNSIEDQSLNQLWIALKSAVHSLVELYGDSKMHDYVHFSEQEDS